MRISQTNNNNQKKKPNKKTWRSGHGLWNGWNIYSEISLKEYKVRCDLNGKDFEQDLSAMYTEIRRCLAIDHFDEFEPKSPTKPEKPLNEENSEKYQDYKKHILNLTQVPRGCTWRPRMRLAKLSRFSKLYIFIYKMICIYVPFWCYIVIILLEGLCRGEYIVLFCCCYLLLSHAPTPLLVPTPRVQSRVSDCSF